MALSQEPRGATRSFQIVAKRLFDIIIAATVLIVISPLFLLASLAIKLGSRGPVFSGQIEYCYNNQKIKIFKFRCSTFGGLPTHTGRFLFQSGLDRLPMLINVLRGEMSIVGPCSYIAPPSLPPAEHLSAALRRNFRVGPDSLLSGSRCPVRYEAANHARLILYRKLVAPSRRKNHSDERFSKACTIAR